MPKGRKKKNNDEIKYVITDIYDDTIKEIVEKFHEYLGHINVNEIIVLEDISTDNRGTNKKIVYADVCLFSKRFADIYEETTNKKKKYALTVYSAHCEHMSESQKNLLLFHELLHIGEKGIVKHNVEDFSIIVDKFSTQWDSVYNKGIRNILDPDFEF
jgi:predicted metallopeptidase